MNCKHNWHFVDKVYLTKKINHINGYDTFPDGSYYVFVCDQCDKIKKVKEQQSNFVTSNANDANNNMAVIFNPKVYNTLPIDSKKVVIETMAKIIADESEKFVKEDKKCNQK